MDYQSELRELKKEHEFFIGVDSDGCVFDTMEIKQKEFFIPNALKYFRFDAISSELTETWEFVNLYSVHRGGNRFNSLVKVFELLGKRRSVIENGIKLPDLSALQSWIRSGSKLSNADLHEYFKSNYDPDLEKVVMWTDAVNNEITARLHSIQPYPQARKAIERISQIADVLVISQTPLEALEREWTDNNIRKFVSSLAGQEHGTKTEHIAIASKSKYPDDRILMIGDAIGDLEAARNNGVLFYPIVPGKEDESWKQFLNEGIVKFTEGLFRGNYERSVINNFKRYLPDSPPWRTVK